MPLVAVSMLSLMGVVAMAIDVGSIERERRLVQTAADAGALAGAAEIFRGRWDLVTGSAQAETARNGMTNSVAGVIVNVANGPASGYYVGDDEYVEVVVSRTTPTLFGFFVGRGSVAVTGRGVAGVEAPAFGCLFALSGNAEKALNVSGSTSSLTVEGCQAVVNSTNNKAVLIESSGTFEAQSLGVTGGIDAGGGNLVLSDGSQTGVPPSANPLGYLQMPAFDPNYCTYNNTKVDNSGTTFLNPGIYCGGIEITSNGTASLNPGLYILRGGGLKMGGGSISGTGVTFVNTNATPANGGADKFGKIEIGSAASANLSAMTSGDLAGILIFQDPAAGKPGDVYENVIASGSSAIFNGTLYFPTQPLELGASGSSVTVNGGVVASTIKVTSGSDVTITGTYGGSSVFKRISLVE